MLGNNLVLEDIDKLYFISIHNTVFRLNYFPNCHVEVHFARVYHLDLSSVCCVCSCDLCALWGNKSSMNLARNVCLSKTPSIDLQYCPVFYLFAYLFAYYLSFDGVIGLCQVPFRYFVHKVHLKKMNHLFCSLVFTCVVSVFSGMCQTCQNREETRCICGQNSNRRWWQLCPSQPGGYPGLNPTLCAVGSQIEALHYSLPWINSLCRMVGSRSWRKQRSRWMTVWPAAAASRPLRASSSRSRATKSSLKCCATTRCRWMGVCECLCILCLLVICFCSLLKVMAIILGLPLHRPVRQSRRWWWCRCHRSPEPPSQHAMASAVVRQAGGLRRISKALVGANVALFKSYNSK